MLYSRCLRNIIDFRLDSTTEQKDSAMLIAHSRACVAENRKKTSNGFARWLKIVAARSKDATVLAHLKIAHDAAVVCIAASKQTNADFWTCSIK